MWCVRNSEGLILGPQYDGSDGAFFTLIVSASKDMYSYVGIMDDIILNGRIFTTLCNKMWNDQENLCAIKEL